MSKIDKLTPEQEVQLEQYRKDWFSIGSSTQPADRPTAESAITKLYQKLGKQPPQFFWADGPADALRMLAKMDGSKPVSHLGKEWWGQQDSYWIAFYLFARDILGVQYNPERNEELNIWADIARSCGWWWPYENVCVISERPTSVSWETGTDTPRIHCANGPAILTRDGHEVYAWHGIRVPARVIMNPETITTEEIDKEANVEIRRVLLERYGMERYLCEMEIVAEDEVGQLYRREHPISGDPLLIVKVINSTPEPDGTYKTYTLPVPAEITTPREGVAWTFGLEANKYRPEIET